MPWRQTITTLFLFLTIEAIARADEVVLVPGSTVKQAVGGRVRGSIQSESAAEVVVKLGANLIHVPADQIESVRYEPSTPSFTLAEVNESGGDLAKAVELYKKGVEEASSGGKPLVERAARFRLAMATADLAGSDPSKLPEAMTLLDKFARRKPDGEADRPGPGDSDPAPAFPRRF